MKFGGGLCSLQIFNALKKSIFYAEDAEGTGKSRYKPEKAGTSGQAVKNSETLKTILYREKSGKSLDADLHG